MSGSSSVSSVDETTHRCDKCHCEIEGIGQIKEEEVVEEQMESPEVAIKMEEGPEGTISGAYR